MEAAIKWLELTVDVNTLINIGGCPIHGGPGHRDLNREI
jgi:hypothetical protein